jgi:N-hydroxyarylamine O-acetyltransferase
MCRYHQTSPESSFTRRRVCTLATPRGRLTLSDLRLIVTEGAVRHESQLSEVEWRRTLEERFGIGAGGFGLA